MNGALGYLWLTLLKRRALHGLRSLRHPTRLIGFAAVIFFIGVLFHYRHLPIFGQLVREESLLGGALVMLCGSIYQGFLQRGLVFEPADVEFLFTSPFSQRQIICYRLLSCYLFAVVQGLVFLGLFAGHLQHPWLTAIGVTLFQLVCFHIGAGVAIVAGKMSEQSHYRARWMLLAVYFVLTAVYLRAAWDLKFVPGFVSSPFAQLIFYPAVTISELSSAPAISHWTWSLVSARAAGLNELWQPAFYLTLLSLSALVSLMLVIRLKGNLFETSLASTTRQAERRLRLRQDRTWSTVQESRSGSVPLPKRALFRGMGAIIWKNLVVASRSRRELAVAAAFTLIYTGFLIELRWAMHKFMVQGDSMPDRHLRDFDLGLFGMMAVLAFLLQRAFPFDFRRDGHQLLAFRNLPLSPLALALAQVAVPTLFCVAFQMVGIVVLMCFASFEWVMLLLLLLAFPAVALGLNGVWNLHYLLAASRRAGGKVEAVSGVTMVMVVALSFLIFYPAGWVAYQVGRHTPANFSNPVGFSVWLVIQYLVDFVLLLALARLFQRFEVAPDRR